MTIDHERLQELQWHQLQHDVDYHPDVASMGLAARMKHFTLHLVKYAAYLLDAEDSAETAKLERALVDSFAIILAIANTLGQDLSKEVPLEPVRLADAHDRNFNDRDTDALWRTFVREVGVLAKACESLDHIEDLPFKPMMKKANCELARAVITAAGRSQIDIESTYRERLRSVETRSMFDRFIQGRRPGSSS